MSRTPDRSRVVSVRLSRAEHAAAQAEAQAAGAPIGAWLRLRMLYAQDGRDSLAALEARLAAIEAGAAAHTDALEKLERAVEKNFTRLAEAVRARPAAAGASSAPRPAATTPPPRT